MCNYYAQSCSTHTLYLLMHNSEPWQKLKFFLFFPCSLRGKLISSINLTCSPARARLARPPPAQSQDVGLALCPGLHGTLKRSVRQVCLPQLRPLHFSGATLKFQSAFPRPRVICKCCMYAFHLPFYFITVSISLSFQGT